MKNENVQLSFKSILKLSFYLLFLVCSCQSSPKTTAELFADYYQGLAIPKDLTKDPDLMNIRSSLLLYQEGKHEQAIYQFEEVAKTTPQKYQFLLRTYWGISLLRIGDVENALQRLNEVEPHSDYGEEALWYKGLTYIYANKLSEAQSTFQQILKKENHYKKETSKELIKELQKLISKE